MDLNPRDGGLDELLEQFPDATAALAASASVAPPPGLRSRVLGAALAARPAGRPPARGPGAADPISPAEGFARMIDDLGALLDELGPDEWDAVALAPWSVRGVLGHLTAIEEYLGEQLGLWPARPRPDEGDHRGMTEAEVAAAEGADPAELVARWRQVSEAVVGAARAIGAEQLDERVIFHGFSYRWRSLLVARTFEVWTHASDIRAATGRPRVDPGPARLQLMTDVAVRALPIGLALAGRDVGDQQARIVLTGPGGGAWLQPLALDGGSGVGADPSVTLIADAVDFCRVAAQRLSPADLDVVIEGDRALGEDLLVGVAVFAA